MNILWITTVKDSFFFKTSRVELANALNQRGHSVLLMMKRNFGEKKKNTENTFYYPILKYSILSGIISAIYLFFQLPFIIKKKRIDVIISGGIIVLFPFSLIFKILKIPVILDIRGIPIDKKEIIFFDLYIAFSKFSLDWYTTITPELKKIISEKYQIDERKIGIWSSGVSLNHFNKRNIISTDITDIVKSKSLIGIYHGSYSPSRGVENILESLCEIDSSIKDKILILFVGFSSEVIQKLLIYCQKFNIQEQVHFIKPVPYEQIASYIEAADVGIIPLPPENIWWKVSSPLKTLEYLALGKPVIATNIPFHQRIFEKGACGLLIESADPRTIANAITFMCKNKNELQNMGDVGREIIKKYYTWEIKAIELEQFLNDVIGQT